MEVQNLLNRTTIYNTLFWSLITVSEYPNLERFKNTNPSKYNQWVKFVSTKYGEDKVTDENYLKYSQLYPEFSKLLSAAYATIESDNGQIKRKFKIISEKEEYNTIAKFTDVLDYYYNVGHNTTPKFDYVMAGYDLTNYDIPTYLKKFMHYYNKDNNREIPMLIKYYMIARPWESNTLNIKNIYKFNSNQQITDFDVMAKYINLKQPEDLIGDHNLSSYYWNNINSDPEGTMKRINFKLTNTLNTCIQFVNNFRYI